jgi:colanic acid/amylovoran biosynthesis glycosyltransferase
MRIAYIASFFPNLSTTFVLSEMLSVQSLGHELLILALRGRRQMTAEYHPGTERLLPFTHYAGLRDFEIWVAGLRFLLRHPKLFLTLLVELLVGSFPNPFSIVKALYVFAKAPYLAEILVDGNVQHVHAEFASLPATGAMVIARIAGIPFSFTAHAFDLHVKSLKLRNDLLGKKVELADFVIAEHAHGRDFLLKTFGSGIAGKVFVVRSGVNIELFRPQAKCISMQQPKRLRILSIGRLVEKKGHEFLLKACALLKKRGVQCECVLLGEGPLKLVLQRLVEDLDLQSHVIFVPPMTQDQVLRLYCQADLFVLPCVVAQDGNMDGIPTVLIEAMAVGLPVISTPIAGIPELIQDGVTGILVAPRDPEELAAKVETLFHNPETCQELGLAGREWVKVHFDTRTNAARLAALFETRGQGQQVDTMNIRHSIINSGGNQ